MKYLGVDFGLRRIGLAISEGQLSSPFKVIEVNGLSEAIEKTAQIIAKGGFDKIIVGLPEGRFSKTVLGFINSLKKRGFEVESTEETLSTKNAIKNMIEGGIPKKKRRMNDAYSAAIILEHYFDIHNLSS